MMRTLFASAFFIAGCATAMPAQPAAQKGAESAGDPVIDAHTDPDRGSPTSKSRAAKPLAELEPPGAILRAELAKVLDRSPGYFLQHVQTEPRFTHGRFHGWRVVSFFPGDSRFAGIDLHAGDVVMRVNGKPIEQPDQFMVGVDRAAHLEGADASTSNVPARPGRCAGPSPTNDSNLARMIPYEELVAALDRYVARHGGTPQSVRAPWPSLRRRPRGARRYVLRRSRRRTMSSCRRSTSITIPTCRPSAAAAATTTPRTSAPSPGSGRSAAGAGPARITSNEIDIDDVLADDEM